MLNRLRSNPWLRAAIVLVVLVAAGIALHDRWGQASKALSELSPWVIGGSMAAALAGLGAQMLAWRALLADLGSPLPVPVAARIMFLGQMGKYLPGSVWAFLAQVELAKDRAVPRQRGLAATVLAVAVTLTVNLAIAAATLPLTSGDAAQRWWWVLALAPVLLILLHPRIVTWLIHTALRVARRATRAGEQELEHVSARGMTAAVGWSLLAWVPLTLHVWLLIEDVGGAGDARTLPTAAGAYALAWTLGVLFIVAPAGLGVREVVLVVALAPVLDAGSALVVATVSRLVMTVADLAWAGGTFFTARRTGTPDANGPVHQA